MFKIMLRHSKASTAAHTKWKQCNNQFTWTSPEISDTGSLYNDPGDENSGDESSVSDDFNSIEEMMMTLQNHWSLYRNSTWCFCIPTNKKRCRKEWRAITVMENLHLLTGNSKVESCKLIWSEPRRGMIYTEDSHTSDWQKRKSWSKAAEGC